MPLRRNIICIAPLLLVRVAHSQPVVPNKLPVREVTVFKDGHAFVLHEGSLPVGNSGEVTLDYLPTPVIGTFWPYAVGKSLKGVVASRQLVTGSRKVYALRELLRANIGAEITVIESQSSRFDATILDVPIGQPSEVLPELAGSNVNDERDRFDGSHIILLQTKEGVRVRAIGSLGEVIFKNQPKTNYDVPEYRNLLQLQLENPPKIGEKAEVGLVYLQKGLRWIPNYRLSLDGSGKAELKMQATLANELVDLDGATVNLVVGVPSFTFKDVVDPLALQSTFAKLSPLFDPTSRSAGAFANNIASQSYGFANAGRTGERVRPDGGTPDLAGGDEGGSSEDYYLYPLKNISLKKNQRMTFPLSTASLTYQDIYTYEAPAVPPPSMYREFNYQERSANLSPTSVMHKIRLSNAGKAPLTSAPTLVDSRGQLLAQTLMTYTAVGGRTDIDLAPAVDVTVKRQETELKRTPDALKWQDTQYARIDVEGRLTVSSYRNAPITLEFSQQKPGTVDSASHKGVIRKLGAGDEAQDSSVPTSWANYDSGSWLSMNGISKVEWKLAVPAKGKLEVTYQYHYFSR
ncbi:hypothetical protein EON80_08235 [bacterium]|nr:MAG: hypothetical protein EON80_08235 [bacterium]